MSGKGPASQAVWFWMAVWLAAVATLVGAIQGGPGDTQAATGAAALSQSVLAGHDAITHGYPAAWWGWQQIRATGRIPLWNPSWFCGEAFVASQTFMVFYPPNWLGAVLPFPLAFNIQYPLHLLLAAIVMAWACRRRSLGWMAAGLAGLAWALGGHLATLAGPGHIQKLQALTWLPMVTLGARQLVDGQARRGFLALGGGLALQLTAGHLQIVWLTALAASAESAVVIAWHASRLRSQRMAWRAVGRRIGWGLGAAALAIGLSAIFLVPMLEFAHLSNRQGSLQWKDAPVSSLPPEEAAEFVFPRLLGDSQPNGRGAYLGRYGMEGAPERAVSDYVGAGVLVFAAFGLLLGGPRRWKIAAYLALAAGALLLSLGRFAPGFCHQAMILLPGLSHLHSPSDVMALLSYGWVMAAAHGLEALLHPFWTEPAQQARRFRMTGSLLLLGAIGAILLLVRAKLILIGQEIHPVDQSHPLVAAQALEMNLWAQAVQHFARGAVLILTLAGLWAWIQSLGERLSGRCAAGVACLGLLIAVWGWDLLSNDAPFWTCIDEGPYRDASTHYWALEKWKKEEMPVRYLEVGNEQSNRALTLSDFKRLCLISYAGGYHPITYRKYTQMRDRLGFLHPNFLRLFAIGDLIVPAEKAHKAPPGYFPAMSHDNQVLLETESRSYVRQINHIKLVDSWEALVDRLADPFFNPYESTTMLRKDFPKGQQAGELTLKPAHVEAHVYPIGPGHMRISCVAREQALLIISEPNVPGWCAISQWTQSQQGLKINVVRDLITADGFFPVVRIPGGRSMIDLWYDPVSQRVGLYLTLLTLGVLAVWAGRGAGCKFEALRQRRKRVHYE